MGQFRKNVNQRLSVLELAQALGNVSEACRRENITRTQFYEYKKRFQTMGLDGLRDILPARKGHPHTTPVAVADRILILSLDHPGWGCVRLSEELKRENILVSSPTVQNILIKNGMGSKQERIQKLEEKLETETVELSQEQLELLEKTNPCYRERFSRGAKPGGLLAQDTIFLGFFNGVGKVYIQAVVDTYSNYAFGFLNTSKTPDSAVALLYNDVLPFFKEQHLTIEAIITNNSREYCGRDNHHYELFILLNDIEHRHTQVRQFQANGFVKRFGRIAIADFFAKRINERISLTLEGLQTDFDAWVLDYNTKRPHRGFPNMGKKPLELIEEYKKNRK